MIRPAADPADLGLIPPDLPGSSLNNPKIGGVLVATDRRQARVPLPELVAAAVAGGARSVLLREKDLPRAARAELAVRLRELLAPVGGRLIVAGTDPLDGDSVHLAASDPPMPATRPSGPGRSAGVWLVGRSCHDPAELARLTTEDYATLSPVFASASKPGYGPVLGLERLAEWCALAGRTVLALGGIETPQRAAACVRAGAAGVAVMGAVMRAEQPAAVVAELVAAVTAAGTSTSRADTAAGRRTEVVG